MDARRLSALLSVAVIIIMIAGCSQTPAGKTVEVTESPDTSDNLKQALEKPISASAAQSPGGGRLTVQYAVMAICEAAGVPYQFEKSKRLAGDECRRFIAPLQVNGIPATQALSDLLAPLNLRYEVDDAGVYLSR
ncbi:MAG TPA: hypothetical protein VMZ06_03020 [Candidatus Bathyarchaeia archaeon]|nr:hypothetical protein [Candidatus Bathyarchaeia archaeon]